MKKSKTQVAEMQKSRLVQRLDIPPKGSGRLGKDNPFAFGGGYKNGGLSDEAMDLLREIWSFDYMGAAEFEFGAVPHALNRIAEAADAGHLVAITFTIPIKDVAKDFRDKSRKDPEGEATLYLICPEGWVEEAQARIKGWAGEPWNSDLKESTHLSSVLRPPADDKYPARTRGWLELDNGFLFFADAEMAEKARDLFGLEGYVDA